jgi:hypothetical protein
MVFELRPEIIPQLRGKAALYYLAAGNASRAAAKRAN